MTNREAQLAYFGAIDDAVCRATNPDTLKMVNEFLPGSTSPGRRGWYGELQRYVNRNRDALQPVTPPAERADAPPESPPIVFPSLARAVQDVSTQPPVERGSRGDDDTSVRDPKTAPVTAKLLYASTVLGKIAEMEQPQVFGAGNEDVFRSPDEADPLTLLLEQTSQRQRSECRTYAGRLRDASDRAAYGREVGRLAADGMIPQAVSAQPGSCNGRLRNVGGRFCSVVTTDWPRGDITLDEMAATIEPFNWPLLYDFFVDMLRTRPRTNNGWTRVLEVVSPDRDKWQLRTTLKYWKAATVDTGLCINYDLDDVRDPRDSGLVEVDSGYIWITSEGPGVRIRTSKALRIRGLSPSATAALACHSGWSDAGAQLLTEDAKTPPPGCVAFDPVSPVPEPSDDGDLPAEAADGDPAGPAETAAEHLDLPTGWREDLIGTMSGQVNAYVDTLSGLAVETADRWCDGIDVDDVKSLGGRWSEQLTAYAVNAFEAAMDTMRPTSGDAPEGGA